MLGSPARPMRAVRDDGKRAWPRQANARVRRGMIQIAWGFLKHQKNSALAQWFEARVTAGKKRKTMIVALARKLLIALWRLVTIGEISQGLILRAAS